MDPGSSASGPNRSMTSAITARAAAVSTPSRSMVEPAGAARQIAYSVTAAKASTASSTEGYVGTDPVIGTPSGLSLRSSPVTSSTASTVAAIGFAVRAATEASTRATSSPVLPIEGTNSVMSESTAGSSTTAASTRSNSAEVAP